MLQLRVCALGLAAGAQEQPVETVQTTAPVLAVVVFQIPLLAQMSHTLVAAAVRPRIRRVRAELAAAATAALPET
jgi:hypothetical protein